MTRRPVDQAGHTVARHRTQLLWDAMDDAIALDSTGDTMVETPTPAPPTPTPTPTPEPAPQPDPTTPSPSPTQPQ